jgi:hypothetical protein
LSKKPNSGWLAKPVTSQLPGDDVRFAQSSQATAGVLLRQSLARTQKSWLKTATLFLKSL